MRFVTASARFSSSHMDPSEGLYLHGHTFFVSVTEQGTIDALPLGLKEDLDAVVSELHLHKLSDMLVGGSERFDSLAAWIMERLLGRHPRIIRTEIMEYGADVRYAVERELR
jgi:hypothetical protein